MAVPFKRCKPGRRSAENFFRFLLFLRFCAGFSGASLLFSTICTIQAHLGLGLNSYCQSYNGAFYYVNFLATHHNMSFHNEMFLYFVFVQQLFDVFQGYSSRSVFRIFDSLYWRRITVMRPERSE